jgi:hypothetical protein
MEYLFSYRKVGNGMKWKEVVVQRVELRNPCTAIFVGDESM